MNKILIVIIIWATLGTSFYVVALHDNFLEMDKSNKQIINDMNCYNYKYWIGYHEGDWLDMFKDIRAKAQQVKESCK